MVVNTEILDNRVAHVYTQREMKVRTKKPMGRIVMLRLKDSDFELLHAAAERHAISMSEIARGALRARAKSLLKRDCKERRTGLTK
jgi:hypothetical protein